MTDAATALADIAALRDAGLRPADLAIVLKCHRVTASQWLGGSTPHRLLWSKLAKVAAAARSATQAGVLPLAKETLREERTQKIASALVAHLPQ